MANTSQYSIKSTQLLPKQFAKLASNFFFSLLPLLPVHFLFHSFRLLSPLYKSQCIYNGFLNHTEKNMPTSSLNLLLVKKAALKREGFSKWFRNRLYRLNWILYKAPKLTYSSHFWWQVNTNAYLYFVSTPSIFSLSPM